jgi:hypothetical protein
MDLFLIDGIAPFFLDAPEGRLNWSKIPFEFLERDGLPDPALFARIRPAFARFADTAAEWGFNAVTLDDLAHLSDHPSYEPALRRRLEAWRREYHELFRIAAQRGLRPYITSDIAFFTPGLDRALRDDAAVAGFLAGAADQAFREFPALAGLIVRLGESDGLDVRGDFRSRPVLRKAPQARRYLRALLDVCEARQRDLIVRTWSLGAFEIGDLSWNRATYEAVFSGLAGPRLIVSMKHGESDFFRFLPLCRHFHSDPARRKLIELQARREYEGAGEYPSFTGWEYADYARQLATCRNLAGLSMWCQTGGWTAARRLTFVRDSSPWTELNAWVGLRVFKDGPDVEAAVASYCERRFPGRPVSRILELLRLSSEVVRELLYVDAYARKTVFFRRLRLPPLLHVLWDTVYVTPAMRRFLRYFAKAPDEQVRKGFLALAKLRRMIGLAEALDLPAADIRRQYRAFEALAIAREYWLGPDPRGAADRLARLLRTTDPTDPPLYEFRIGGRLSPLGFGLLGLGLWGFLRDRAAYRRLDRWIAIRALPWASRTLGLWLRRHLPDLAQRQGMGWRHFLR